jgi:peroxiredoxin
VASILNRKNILIILAGLIVGAGAGVAILFGFGDSFAYIEIADSGSQNQASVAPALDAPAPNFELETLSGEQLSLEDLRGKTVLLNFWATWCGPCRVEMPAIQSRFERHESELEVLAINFDEPVDQVRAYVQDLGLTFTVLLDPGGEVQRLYRIRGYPSTYIVDEDGIIRVQHIGLMTETQLDGFLSQVGVGE